MTFIDIINDKTNTDIVDSDAEGEQEARDDLRVGLGSVQKRDHVVARIAGSGDKPPTSAPRDRGLRAYREAKRGATEKHIRSNLLEPLRQINR